MELEMQWDEKGLLPAVVQDAQSGQVLMLAYMNAEALNRTLESGEAWFWSRRRQELWHKGATSGNTQRVVQVRYDCDSDALLLSVEPRGPACHTGKRSCFYRRMPALPQEEGSTATVLDRLWDVIRDRRAHPRAGSYTCRLLDAGEPRILQKVGEEAVEVIVAAQSEGNGRLVGELADLLYHSMVLLAARGLSWADLEAELAGRFGE